MICSIYLVVTAPPSAAPERSGAGLLFHRRLLGSRVWEVTGGKELRKGERAPWRRNGVPGGPSSCQAAEQPVRDDMISITSSPKAGRLSSLLPGASLVRSQAAMAKQVLCIYAQPDQGHFQALCTQLRGRPDHFVLDWHGTPAGTDIAGVRAGWLAQAGVVVLLLSSDFFGEPACDAAARAVAHRRPIPVLLRAVTLPKELAGLTFLPRDGVPLVEQRKNRDAVFLEIAKEVFSVLDARTEESHTVAVTASLAVHIGAVIDYRVQDGATARHTPESLPPDALRLPALFARLRADWPARRGILDEAARVLGTWLYGAFARTWFGRLVDAWHQKQTRARLVLIVPQDYADWPWELAQPPELNDPPAVHGALTVLRQHPGDALPPPRGLVLDLVGPAPFVEALRPVVHEAVEGRLPVACPTGEPRAPLRHAIAPAAELRPRVGESPFFVVLQATAPLALPGALFDPWHERGAAWVLLCAAGLEGAEVETFARHLYTGLLVRSETIDLALQRARVALYHLGGEPIAWAFLTLSAKGEPPLLRATAPSLPPPSASIHDFGHEEQATLLKRFLGSRSPLIVVVHGEEGRGHRHVLSRVQPDLEHAGNVLWKPVVTMHWHHIGEPLLTRHQLGGAIARALDLRDDGSQEALEERLARTVADRCEGGKVLVIDITEVLTVTKEAHRKALRELTTELWPAIMHRAQAFRSDLPVFLLVGVAYRRLRAHKTQREEARLTAELVQTLGKLEAGELPGQVRIRVLPELKDIEREYLIEFLVDTCHLRRAEAELRADYVLDHGAARGRNEEILVRMAQLLADLRQHRGRKG